VIVAELLGIPHASLILKIEKTEGGLKVLRELEDGWFQHIELPMPALLTIQSGNTKLRYATLMGIKRAKTKEVRKVTVANIVDDDAAAESGAPVAVLDHVMLPNKQRSTQMLGGSPAEAAAALVEKLQFEVRAI
jgi:electron transfer flavoprotein beta subunit